MSIDYPTTGSWLIKRTGGVSPWQPRWCWITPRAFFSSVTTDRVSPKCIPIVGIVALDKLQPSEAASLGVPSAVADYVFTIQTETRSWFFAAEDPASSRLWMAAFVAALSNNPLPSPPIIPTESPGSVPLSVAVHGLPASPRCVRNLFVEGGAADEDPPPAALPPNFAAASVAGAPAANPDAPANTLAPSASEETTRKLVALTSRDVIVSHYERPTVAGEPPLFKVAVFFSGIQWTCSKTYDDFGALFQLLCATFDKKVVPYLSLERIPKRLKSLWKESQQTVESVLSKQLGYLTGWLGDVTDNVGAWERVKPSGMGTVHGTHPFLYAFLEFPRHCSFEVISPPLKGARPALAGDGGPKVRINKRLEEQDSKRIVVAPSASSMCTISSVAAAEYRERQVMEEIETGERGILKEDHLAGLQRLSSVLPPQSLKALQRQMAAASSDDEKVNVLRDWIVHTDPNPGAAPATKPPTILCKDIAALLRPFFFEDNKRLAGLILSERVADTLNRGLVAEVYAYDADGDDVLARMTG